MGNELVPFRSRVQLDTLFESLFQEFWSNPAFVSERNWRPTLIKEVDRTYHIEIELPRIKKEEVSVDALDGVLTISVNNEKLSFTRSFRYSDMDIENTQVKLSDGVLYIDVPKLPSQSKRLEIKTI